MESILFMFAFIGLYFLPSIFAYSGKKKNKSAILTLNLFLGWTVLGWVVALIWSQTKD